MRVVQKEFDLCMFDQCLQDGVFSVGVIGWSLVSQFSNDFIIIVSEWDFRPNSRIQSAHKLLILLR